MKGKRPVFDTCIFLLSDRQWALRYRTLVFTQPFSWRLHITITSIVSTTMICWRCHS